MPVVDCEDYSLKAMNSGPMSGIAEQLRASGEDPNLRSLSFVNIYFGVNDLQVKDGGVWFVCVQRPYGYLTVVFHAVRHGDVVVTTLPQLAESKGLCVTLLWTSADDIASELLDAIRSADSMIKQVEMLRGVPLPLPIKRAQLPDRFAVKTITPTTVGQDGNVVVSVLLPENSHGLFVDQSIAFSVGALVEALMPIQEIMNSPLKRALHISSNWQRQAIRALGMEEWSDVVIASNVWIETFAVQLTVMMNEAAKSPISDVQSAVTKGGLARFINTYLGQRFLKGRWDHTDESSEFGKWFKNCLSLRNKVVHSGHFATEAEAISAYDSAHEFARYVTKLAAGLKEEKFAALLEPLRLMRTAGC